MPGNRRGGEYGTAGVQQRRNFHRLPEANTGKAKQLREKHSGPLNVVWDNAPAHHGDAVRTYLATPGSRQRLVSLPEYSADFNAAEAIWDWVREEVTANLCLGAKAAMQEKYTSSPSWLTGEMRSNNGDSHKLLDDKGRRCSGTAEGPEGRPIAKLGRVGV